MFNFTSIIKNYDENVVACVARMYECARHFSNGNCSERKIIIAVNRRLKNVDKLELLRIGKVGR